LAEITFDLSLIFSKNRQAVSKNRYQKRNFPLAEGLTRTRETYKTGTTTGAPKIRGFEMRKLIRSRIGFHLLVAGAGIAACFSTKAQVISETFNYTVGANLNGQNGGSGFSSAWSEGNDFDKIQSGNLSYPSFPSLGNSVSSVPPQDFSTAPFRAINTISGTDGTSLWVGYLFQKNSDNTQSFPVDSDYFGLVVYGSTGNGVFIGDPGDSTKFAVGTAGAGTGAGELSSTDVTLHSTAFLVAKIDFHSGADTISLFVNPDISAGTPSTPSATKNNLDLGNITSIGFLAGWNAVYSYDEIRAGATFSSVPEPVSAVWVLGACGLFAVIRRYRARRA
jgi:hypothetical protein